MLRAFPVTRNGTLPLAKRLSPKSAKQMGVGFFFFNFVPVRIVSPQSLDLVRASLRPR